MNRMERHPLGKKRVVTRHEVLPVLSERWSPRSFDGRAPAPEILCSMFEAARLAPSAHNTQPVRFLIARKGVGRAYERLFACLMDDNKTWAHTAPVLILAAVMRRRFSQEKGGFVPYPHGMHDLGLAVMSLIVQAHELGLHCHPMAAFDPEAAQAEFSIPDLFEPGVVIAVGFVGEPERLPPALRDKELGPRTRRPLEELVFEEDWGVGSPLFAGETGPPRRV
jgi:nitroreductase